MVNFIRTAVSAYKKANNVHNVDKKNYPEIIENLFNVKISSKYLQSISGEDLMEILLKKEV